MDLSDATKILLDRVQKLEPEIATKIMGCILIQNHGEREMIRLACAPENLLENLVQKTKLQLGYLAKPPISTTLSSPIAINLRPVSDNHIGSRLFSSPPAFWIPTTPYWDQESMLSPEFAPYGECVVDEFGLQIPAPFLGFENQLDSPNAVLQRFPGDIYCADSTLGSLNMKASRHSPSVPEFPIKTCHYFNKGFCKHGTSCRYLHEQDNFFPIISPNDFGMDDHMFCASSLEKLDLEISELLKPRRGNPISIASLPMLYYEKYGRTLQADGYLTESRRHGRAGYSLTKLLARLKRIRLIDRPHGQHCVILAEDASKYSVENRSERNDLRQVVDGSNQIYLTFPAESTFTKEDVSNYFGTFGAVQDVRIPCQQKRMFGFVTFASANTVKTVLSKGNPHFVCGSRVLVKPYREKSKIIDRKYLDKNENGMYYHGNYFDLESDFHPMPRFEAPRFLQRQLMEEQEKALEMERRHLSELQLGRKNNHNQQFYSYGMEMANSLEEHCHYLLDAFSICSVGDDRPKHQVSDYTDQESQGLNLPDSPFASALGSGISTVI